jgi:hypothetical protein
MLSYASIVEYEGRSSTQRLKHEAIQVGNDKING